MAFVKLDCAMLNSSIWPDKDSRDIFITALLMAEPRELLEPIKQMNVIDLYDTGWEVPAGWYGFVEAAGPGIAARAGVDWTRAALALTRLGNPEPESRSQAFGGRRMVRVDGGYIILNFIAYREKDYGAAERMRRFRERQKLRRNSDESNATAQRLPRNVTQAEAEAEAEGEGKPNTPAPNGARNPKGSGEKRGSIEGVGVGVNTGGGNMGAVFTREQQLAMLKQSDSQLDRATESTRLLQGAGLHNRTILKLIAKQEVTPERIRAEIQDIESSGTARSVAAVLTRRLGHRPKVKA